MTDDLEESGCFRDKKTNSCDDLGIAVDCRIHRRSNLLVSDLI